MLTGQSDGGRPITDPGVLGGLPGMCGQRAWLQDLQQRVCLKRHNRAHMC